MRRWFGMAVLATLALGGCTQKAQEAPGGAAPPATTVAAPEPAPAGPFVLAWSEYPSWSVFDVAHAKGLVDRAPGKLGPLEKKWNVDIVLKGAEYDPCITMYGAGEADAVAITNMDILKPSLARKSVAILPTSTSYGADALLVTKAIKQAADLKKYEVRGLDLSVSEYMFARNLQVQNLDPKGFKFTSMDPGAAAMAMQQKQKGIEAIAVWNPFVLDTLEKRAGDVRVLFDSTSIPGEIVDMIVVADASLKKPGGKDFAHALIDMFYAVNRDLADPAKRDDTLVAIGEKFSNLPLERMKKVVEQTRFYGTAETGIKIFTGGALLDGVTSKTLQDIMPLVLEFSVGHGILDTKPTLAYGPETPGGTEHLRFDPSFMQAVAARL